MNVAAPAVLEPESVEIDPGPCHLCGRTIDEHSRVDTFEGSIFLCDDGPGDLVRQWELADPRDRWKYTGETPPEAEAPASIAKPPYRTPQSTIDAFWFVVSLNNPDYLKSWLVQHPLDAPHLHRLWEAKCSTAAA